jgi:hypothetical protein
MYHEDELQHHGVKDQQWGVQNGPPYPLSGENKKAAKKFYREQRRQDRIARRQERELKKNRKFEEARQKMLAKANIKEIRRHSDWFSQQEIESAMRKRQMLDASKPSKKKQKVLEEADLKKIQKHPERYTQDEMRYAITRHQLLEEHKRTKSDEQIKKEEELNNRLAKLEKAAKIATAATTIIGLGTAGLKLVNEYKATKTKDIETEDKRWKTQYDALKGINKTIALDSFNKYWKTDYTPSKSDSVLEESFRKLTDRLNAYDPVDNKKEFDAVSQQLKTLQDIMGKETKNDKD